MNWHSVILIYVSIYVYIYMVLHDPRDGEGQNKLS